MLHTQIFSKKIRYVFLLDSKLGKLDPKGEEMEMEINYYKINFSKKIFLI